MYSKFLSLSLIFLFAFASLAYGLDKQRDCKCRLNVNSRITGGRKAAENKYPWYASISVSGYSKNYPKASDDTKMIDHTCAGTIVNEK